jgi:hypothetical protein
MRDTERYENLYMSWLYRSSLDNKFQTITRGKQFTVQKWGLSRDAPPTITIVIATLHNPRADGLYIL